MERSRLVKITFEYEDGKVDWLEDDEARRWESAANGVIMFNHAHGVNFPQFNWKTKHKKKKLSDGV